MFTNALIELLGWCGAAAILAAYALNGFGFFHSQSLPYLLLNLGGSLGIIVVSFRKKAYQPAALNIVWLAIAAVGIVRAL